MPWASWSVNLLLLRPGLQRFLEDFVPRQHLGAILVNETDESRGLDPRLAVHLDWHPLVTRYGDFDAATLRAEKDMTEIRLL